MNDAQETVQDAIDQMVESGAETGLQVAVYQNGGLVVDATAGVADSETGRPVTSDTLFYAASVGKGMTATLAHILAERGELNYDTPIAEIWPEFAAHGKGKVTVRDALTHRTGVPGVPEYITPEDLQDWDKMVASIADSEPWWEPGTKSGYHAMSFGYIVGEIVRRVAGKPLHQVLEDEIAKPLGVSGELYYGVPDSAMDRVARLVEIPPDEPPAFELPADHPIFKICPPVLAPSAELYNSRNHLTADMPSGGTMSARAIARMYAALLGEVDGVRLVSPERLELIRTVVEDDDVDQVMQFPTPKTLGYFNGRFDPAPASPPTEFGYGGMIGTHADASPETGTSFALMKTRYNSGDFSAAATLVEVIGKSLTT